VARNEPIDNRDPVDAATTFGRRRSRNLKGSPAMIPQGFPVTDCDTTLEFVLQKEAWFWRNLAETARDCASLSI